MLTHHRMVSCTSRPTDKSHNKCTNHKNTNVKTLPNLFCCNEKA